MTDAMLINKTAMDLCDDDDYFNFIAHFQVNMDFTSPFCSFSEKLF